MTLNLLQEIQKAVNAKYDITSQESKIVQAIINNNPDSFNEIDATLNEIMKDGKVDIHDIPNIILLVTQIIKNRVAIKNVDLSSAIEFIVYVILDLLPIPQAEVKIIKYMVDASIGLLKINVNYIENTIHKMDCCVPKRKA